MERAEMHGVDWDHLRAFLAVARSGRLAAAARRMGVEHTTVSRRLAALERELGVTLFYRTAAGYLLTERGQRVVREAEAMEASALAIGARAREGTGPVAGRVRLALVPEFASHWLAPLLPAFRRLEPAIELQVLVGTRLLNLSRGEADVAVQTPRPAQPGLVAVRIAQATTGLYASRAFLRGRRLRVADAASARGLPLLAFTPAFDVLQSAPWFREALESAHVVLTTNSTHTLLAAARASVGVAVLPRFVARGHDDLVSVSEDVATRDVWLVTHPEFRRDPRVRVTTDFLKREAAGPRGIR
jgi:DNA-binding transcriptional LysR family regulator